MHEIFSEITLVVVLAGALGIVLHLLKQPAIVGYVLTGLIVGPLGFMHLDNTEILNSLSGIGITLLLFMVGLELTLKDLRQIGWSAAVVGIAQIVIMTGLGAFIFTQFGAPLRAALYMGLGVGISSTIIAVKIISEKKDLDSLYGKLVLGILIIEDIVSIVALALITGFEGQQVAALSSMMLVVVKLVLLFGLAILASRYIFPWVVEKMSGSGELIFLFSLAWGLGFATLISERLFGLTAEIGGFLAGLTLANTAAHAHISNRMKPLRDFFLILFFIVLGSQLVIEDFSSMIVAALGIAVLGIAIKPVFTFIILTLFGYKGRTSFLTASSLAHISEFSIILVVLGWQSGHLSEEVLSTMTLATILSFVGASYVISHNQSLAKHMRKFLSWWDPPNGSREGARLKRSLRGHIVLIGGHRTAHSLLHSLDELHKKFVVVDFNPAVVKKLQARGIKTVFGDISDPEVQDQVNLSRAKLVISTVPDFQDNIGILDTVKAHESRAKIILSANNDWEARKLYHKGAHYVLMPNFLSGLQLAELLKKDVNLKVISKLKERDLELINQTI